MEEKTVKEIIAEVDESIEGYIKYLKEKHEEFETKFNVLKEIKSQVGTNQIKTINPDRLILVCADYPNIADWFLTEYGIVTKRLTEMEEVYVKWYGPRANYAETEMQKNKEHITQATIKTKVSILYATEYKDWQNELLKMKVDKEMLKERLKIIHDARYSLNTLSILRPIWDVATRGDAPVDANMIDAADNEMKNNK